MGKKVKGIKISKQLQEKFKFDEEGKSVFGSSLSDIHELKGHTGTSDMELEGDLRLHNRIADALFGLPRLDGTANASELQELVDNAAHFDGFMIYLTTASAIAPFLDDEKIYFCENGTWHPSPFLSAQVEPDTDGDGVVDSQDAFPNDPAETTDSDADGVGDNADLAPNNPLLTDVTPVADGMPGAITLNFECTFHHHPSSYDTGWQEYYQPFAAILKNDILYAPTAHNTNPIDVHTLILPTGKAGDGAVYETYNQGRYGNEIKTNYVDLYPRLDSELLISALYGTAQRSKIYNPIYTPATNNDATAVETGTLSLPQGQYEIMCDRIITTDGAGNSVSLPGATLVLTDSNGVTLPRRFVITGNGAWYEPNTSVVYDGLELTDHDGAYGSRKVWIDGNLVADGLDKDSVINRFTHPDFVFTPSDQWQRVDVAANTFSGVQPFGRIGMIDNHNPSTRERNVPMSTFSVANYKYEQTTAESPAYIQAEPSAQSYFTFHVYYNGGEVKVDSPNNSANSGANAYLNPIKHIISRDHNNWDAIPQVSIPSSPAIVRVGDFADHDAWAAARGPGAGDATSPTAMDLEDGDVSNSISTVGSVDTTTPGFYDLTFFTQNSQNEQSAGETITVEVRPAQTEATFVFGSLSGSNWGLNNHQGWSPTQRDKNVAHYYFNFQLIGPDWTQTVYNAGQAEGPDSLVQQGLLSDTMTADFLAGSSMSYRLNLGRFEPIPGGDYDQASLEEIEDMTVKMTLKTPEGLLFDPVSNTIVSSSYDATPIHYSPGDTITPATTNPFSPYALTGNLASFVDTDGDAYPDNDDAFPNNPYDWQDSNSNAIGDNLENATAVAFTLDHDKTRHDDWALVGVGNHLSYGSDLFYNYRNIYVSGTYESIPHTNQWHLISHGVGTVWDHNYNTTQKLVPQAWDQYDEEVVDIRNFNIGDLKWLDNTPLYIYSYCFNQSYLTFTHDADNKYPDLHLDYGDGKVLLPQPGAVGQSSTRFYKLTKNPAGKVKIETSLDDAAGSSWTTNPNGFDAIIADLEAGNHFQLLRDFDDDNDLVGNDIDTVPGNPNLAFVPTRQHRFTTYAHPDSGYVYKSLTSDRDGGYVQFSKYNKLSSNFDWSTQGNNGGHGWGPGDGTYNYTIAFEGYAYASSWWKYTEFDTAPDDTIYTFTLTSPADWTAGNGTYLSLGNVNISADPESVYHLTGGIKSATNPDGFQLIHTRPHDIRLGTAFQEPITPPEGTNIHFNDWHPAPDGGVLKIQLKHATDDKIYIRMGWGETEVLAQNTVESLDFIDSEVIDVDLDYYPVPYDQFPNDSSEQVDSDKDGTPDNTDQFPKIPQLQ